MSQEPIITALIARRKAAEVTQSEAAVMAGLSLKTYQRVENGTGDMRLKNYSALIKDLKITDLDVALDTMSISNATAWAVAAASRILPAEARAAMVSMIMIIYRDVIESRDN